MYAHLNEGKDGRGVEEGDQEGNREIVERYDSASDGRAGAHV